MGFGGPETTAVPDGEWRDNRAFVFAFGPLMTDVKIFPAAVRVYFHRAVPAIRTFRYLVTGESRFCKGIRRASVHRGPARDNGQIIGQNVSEGIERIRRREYRGVYNG